jgi:hypothetical protein
LRDNRGGRRLIERLVIGRVHAKVTARTWERFTSARRTRVGGARDEPAPGNTAREASAEASRTSRTDPARVFRSALRWQEPFAIGPRRRLVDTTDREHALAMLVER